MVISRLSQGLLQARSLPVRDSAVIEFGKRRKSPMTYRHDSKIQRTATGSIDYAHYDRRARRIREEDFSGIVARFFGQSGRSTG